VDHALLFLRLHEVLAIHARGIEEFGGIPGVRDVGALESALAAAENRAYYEQATLSMCAATYAYHRQKGSNRARRWRESGIFF
jgi:death-on-curing protein